MSHFSSNSCSLQTAVMHSVNRFIIPGPQGRICLSPALRTFYRFLRSCLPDIFPGSHPRNPEGHVRSRSTKKSSIFSRFPQTTPLSPGEHHD